MSFNRYILTRNSLRITASVEAIKIEHEKKVTVPMTGSGHCNSTADV